MIWRQGPSLWGPCRTVFLKKLFVVKMIGSWESYDRVLSVWSMRYLGEAAGAFKVSGPVFNNKTAKWQCVPRDLATWAANVSVVLMRKWSGPGVPDADTAPWEKGSLCGAMAQLLWRLLQPPVWMSEAGSDLILLCSDCSSLVTGIMHKLPKPCVETACWFLF